MIEKEEHWHLKKEVPIALLLILLANFASFAWYGAKMESRVEAVERIAIESKNDIEKIEEKHREDMDDVKDTMQKMIIILTEIKTTLSLSDIDPNKTSFNK